MLTVKCTSVKLHQRRYTVAVLGKNIWGAWPLIIWEATTAKRNYYRTN